MDCTDIDDEDSSLLIKLLGAVVDTLPNARDRKAFIQRALGVRHPVIREIASDCWGGRADTLATEIAEKVQTFCREPAVGKRNPVTAINYEVQSERLHEVQKGAYLELCDKYGCRAPLIEDIHDRFLRGNGKSDKRRIKSLWTVAKTLSIAVTPEQIRDVWEKCLLCPSQMRDCKIPEGARDSDKCYHLFAGLIDAGINSHTKCHPLYEVLQFSLNFITAPSERREVDWLIGEMEQSFGQLQEMVRTRTVPSIHQMEIALSLLHPPDTYRYEIRRDIEPVDVDGEVCLSTQAINSLDRERLVSQLKSRKNEWNHGHTAHFIFRVPLNLMNLPFEHWTDGNGTANPIGKSNPVVVALNRPRSRDDGWHPRQDFWRSIDVHRCFKDHARPCPAAFADEAQCEADMTRLNECRDNLRFVLLEHTPTEHCLKALTNCGAPIAVWPRCQEAESGYIEAMLSILGTTPLVEIPAKVKDQRKRYGYDEVRLEERHPIWKHLTLYWDNPYRPDFLPGNN